MGEFHGTALILSTFVGLTFATTSQKHEDSRCLCKCPEVDTVSSIRDIGNCDVNIGIVDDLTAVGYQEPRFIYLNASVAPDECDCQNVVLIRLNLTNSQAKSFCPRCKCTFQVRSLTMMKVVIVFVIWIISILVIYMCFLSCLDPILNNKRGGIRGTVSYREQLDEDNEYDVGNSLDNEVRQQRGGGHTSTQMRAVGSSSENVINRLGNQQTKWKQQVKEQRRNIYDKHKILN